MQNKELTLDFSRNPADTYPLEETTAGLKADVAMGEAIATDNSQASISEGQLVLFSRDTIPGCKTLAGARWSSMITSGLLAEIQSLNGFAARTGVHR